MRKTNTLSRFLPLGFPNGAVIRQFSKPCLRCNAMVGAEHMHGIARKIDGHVALSATARCPKCGLSFGVACVIDANKQVRRVVLPPLLFRWYLQILPEDNPELDAAARRDFEEDRKALEAASQPAVTVLAEAEFERANEAVGQYQGKPIPAWIVVKGRRLVFDRVEVQPRGRVQSDEILIDGTLVYRP